MTSTQIAAQIELELMENIAKALNGGNIGSAGWQIEKLADIGALNTKNRRTIRKYAKALDEAMQKEVAEALSGRLTTIDRLFMSAGISKQAASDIGIQQVIISYSSSVAGQANILGNNLLRAAEQTYRDSLAIATQKVLSGAATPQIAMQQTVSAWSKGGLKVLTSVDKNGITRHWQTDSYVNMQLRTAQTAGLTDLTMQRNRDYGNDLIEIDSHVGARPGCAPYQGKVYSQTGATEGYDSLQSTSYGEPDGIFGINCTHSLYIFIPGLSKKTYSPVNKARNEEAYQNSQRQRLLERRIRASKREVAALKANGSDYSQAEKLLKNRQASMREFIDETGRHRYYSKEAV